MKYATLLCDYGGYRARTDVRITAVGRDWVRVAARGMYIPLAFVHTWVKQEEKQESVGLLDWGRRRYNGRSRRAS